MVTLGLSQCTGSTIQRETNYWVFISLASIADAHKGGGHWHPTVEESVHRKGENDREEEEERMAKGAEHKGEEQCGCES